MSEEYIPGSEVYPPVVGFDLYYRYNRKSKITRLYGYTNQKAKRCQCGGTPVFEQAEYDHDPHDPYKPAKVFIGVCKDCNLRTKSEGPLWLVLKEWNDGVYDRDMLMVQKPLTNSDTEACIRLSSVLVSAAMTDAVRLILEKRELKDKLTAPDATDYTREQLYPRYAECRGQLKALDNFFRTSPLLMEMDGETCISKVREAVYPDLTPDERVKIPLKLVNM